MPYCIFSKNFIPLYILLINIFSVHFMPARASSKIETDDVVRYRKNNSINKENLPPQQQSLLSKKHKKRKFSSKPLLSSKQTPTSKEDNVAKTSFKKRKVSLKVLVLEEDSQLKDLRKSIASIKESIEEGYHYASIDYLQTAYYF